MEKYYNEKMSEQLGLDCFDIELIKEIKSVFIFTQEINGKASEYLNYKLSENNKNFKKEFGDKLTEMPIRLYFTSKCFYNGYLYYAEDYDWELNESIKKTEDKIDTSYLNNIPFLEYEVLNINVKYNNKWKRIIKTQKNIILL